MDGVLVDAEPLFQDFMYNYLSKEFNVDDPSTKGRVFTGTSSNHIWSTLKAKHSLAPSVAELKAKARPAYMEYLEALPALPAVPGAVELVAYAYASCDGVALASSASKRRIEFFLSRLNIRQYFSAVFCGDDVERSKPAPDIFLKAADQLGAKPESCTVIEDAVNGVAAAKAANMQCFGYSGAAHNTDDLRQADRLVTDFHDLLAQLQTKKVFL